MYKCKNCGQIFEKFRREQRQNIMGAVWDINICPKCKKEKCFEKLEEEKI